MFRCKCDRFNLAAEVSILLVIHMRKSGGSTLEATLAQALGLGVVQPVALDDFRSLSLIAESSSVISFIHLHPSREAIKFVKSLSIPVLILLRYPDDAYLALRRHADPSGKVFRPNGALFFKNSKKVMREFFYNWLSLRDEANVKVVIYDNLFDDFSSEISSIISFLQPEALFESDVMPINKRLSKRNRQFHPVDVMSIPLNVVSFRYPPRFNWHGHLRFLGSKVVGKLRGWLT